VTVVALLAIAVGLPGLAAAAHLGLLTAASLVYRERALEAGDALRFLVLIPAHEEASVIGRCLGAINADRRRRDVVLVVADRCTDATAAIARRFGASVLERAPGEEPGRAAARQAGLEHARALDWDAVVMLDADSVIAPGFFDACERALARGADAVQARSESRQGRTLATEASLAAFALQGITLPRGRDRLGLSVRLRGTGMAIRRPLALAHRFRAPASEDLVFTLDLVLAGIRCRHVDAARLRSEGESRWSTFGGQKIRYEAGRMAAARAYVPRLLKRAIHHRELVADSSRSRSSSSSASCRRGRVCGRGSRCSSPRGTWRGRPSSSCAPWPACCAATTTTRRPRGPELPATAAAGRPSRAAARPRPSGRRRPRPAATAALRGPRSTGSSPPRTWRRAPPSPPSPAGATP
jgi:hypothetical protein